MRKVRKRGCMQRGRVDQGRPTPFEEYRSIGWTRVGERFPLNSAANTFRLRFYPAIIRSRDNRTGGAAAPQPRVMLPHWRMTPAHWRRLASTGDWQHTGAKL